MLVTPNHRVLTNNRKQIVREAKEFLKLSSQFNFPVSGYCSGIDTYSKEFYELVIAIQADAHLNTDCNSITFSFTKERKITRLKSLLKSLGVLYSNHTSFRKGREETVIRLLAKDNNTATLLRSFFNKDKSLIGNPFLSLSLDTKKHVIESLGMWDGTTKSNGDIVLDTTDFEFVDKMQAVAVTSGYKAMVNSYVKTTSFGVTTIKRLYLSKSTLNSGFKDSAKTLEYNGKIGCVSVPSGFVVVRRNDRVFISGNTLNAKKLGISRDNAKSITYALLYGAAASKLQKMLGLSKEEAEAMYEAYWDAVPPLKALRDDLVAYWEGVDRDHIKAIDGRKLRARSPHSLINLLFQSAGAIMAKWSVVRIAEKLEQQNLLGNPFEDDKDAVKVFQMIVYHKLIVALYSNVY